MPEEMVASLVCDFTSQLEGRFIIATAIAFNGDVLVVSLDHEPKTRSCLGPERFVDQPHQFRIHHVFGENIIEIDLEPTRENIYEVQLMPDRKYLIGGARGNNNLHLYDVEGRPLATWDGGDAIEDVQVAPDGKVWVSHFDEGFSKENSEGLYCFNPQHELLFDYNRRVYSGTLGDIDQPIVDCYMLNVVSARDVWVCPYVGFQLHHLHDFEVKQSYEVPDQMAGAYAFAVLKGRILFDGGYHTRSRVYWYDLHSKRVAEIKPVNDNGEAIEWKYAYGRGSDLFLWNKSVVYRLNVEDFWPSDN